MYSNFKNIIMKNKLFIFLMTFCATYFINIALSATSRCLYPLWFEEAEMPTSIKNLLQ